jgi:hypothetical protein
MGNYKAMYRDAKRLFGNQKAIHYAIGHCGLACLLLVISLFTPRWRVDDIGSTYLDDSWTWLDGLTFDSRQYGVIFVKGTVTHSWMSLAQSACDFQTNSYITGWANTVVNGCQDDQCTGGWFTHIAERCRVYRSVRTLSFATMGITFVAIMLVIVGCFLACMASQKKMGGIICGLFLCSGMLCFLMNVIWAAVTDVGFKDLGETAYYPYPSLGIAYFLHLYGCITLIVASSVYGWIIYPVVVNYDESEAKMNKKIARMEKRAEHKARLQEQGQLQAQQNCMVQQMYPQPQPMGNTTMQMGPQIQMGGVSGAHMPVGQMAHMDGAAVPAQQGAEPAFNGTPAF